MDGWIKSHRAMMDNPIVCKDADYYAVWGYLLHYATHAPINAYFNGSRIILQPGQLITGRRQIAEKFNISESKVKRILICFESDQQIDRQRTNVSSLITVRNWGIYQGSDQRTDQPVTNERPTDDQPVTTIQEYKNERIEECKNDTHTHSFIKNSSHAHARTKGQEMLDWIAGWVPQINEMARPLTLSQCEAIVARLPVEDIKRILCDMCNKGATGNVSAIHTFHSFESHDFILKERRIKQKKQ